MRTLFLIALTLVLAYGVWTLFGDDAETPTPLPEETRPKEPPPPAGTTPVPHTVTLVLTVRTSSNTLPKGTVAGYRWGGDDRVRPVDARGRLVFTDVPTGKVTLIARAPGYEEVEQQRYLTGGVPTDAILTLEARKP